jgi:hypothetical protein
MLLCSWIGDLFRLFNAVEQGDNGSGILPRSCCFRCSCYFSVVVAVGNRFLYNKDIRLATFHEGMVKNKLVLCFIVGDWVVFGWGGRLPFAISSDERRPPTSTNNGTYV